VECSSDKSRAVLKEINITSMSDEEKANMLKATKFLKKLKHTNILVVKDIYKTSNKEK